MQAQSGGRMNNKQLIPFAVLTIASLILSSFSVAATSSHKEDLQTSINIPAVSYFGSQFNEPRLVSLPILASPPPTPAPYDILHNSSPTTQWASFAAPGVNVVFGNF